MDAIHEFDKTEELVETLLEKEPRCRDDDKWLCYRVIRHYTNIYIPFEDFSKFPSFETISRCRRKIQNKEGRFLPTKKVAELRATRQEEVKSWSRS